MSVEPLPPLLCLTMDGLPWSHEEQALQLCQAGARWIQVRMKSATIPEWTRTATAVVAICRSHGALCTINDSVEVARDSGADGVHLGQKDGDWGEARRLLGPVALIGGTVNSAEDARAAVDCGCIDYVGVGPLRFTTTKQNLAPLLGGAGITEIVRLLGVLPAWAIGGVRADDLAGLRRSGVAGVAVSSALFVGGEVIGNFGQLVEAWRRAA